MNTSAVLLLGLAGGTGATLRYLVDRAASARFGLNFPWGTTLINLTGSFALGLATGAALGSPTYALVATGVLGGYTTFSTASLESVQLLSRGHYLAALVQGPGQIVTCVALATVGILI
ncbi:MAG TPA: CrcB family protein [Aeromicrobium sp.]|nr:CrcB family protein [Aeromicrobium sp.]